MNHLFKATGEKLGGKNATMAEWPVERCVCGVKRAQGELIIQTMTRRTVRLRKTLVRFYCKDPLDPKARKHGWNEKAIPCTREKVAKGKPC